MGESLSAPRLDDPCSVQSVGAALAICTHPGKEIASILQDRKMGNWKNKWTEYLVHWKGTPISEASWERGATLWQFEDQILEYMRLKSMRTSTISSGGEFVCPSTR